MSFVFYMTVFAARQSFWIYQKKKKMIITNTEKKEKGKSQFSNYKTFAIIC